MSRELSVSESELGSKKLLLLVAHPDDESIGAGVLMQRNRRVQVVIATSGAPNRPYVWRRFGYPGRCARIRQREARAALSLAGQENVDFLGFPDGRLYRNLSTAYQRLGKLVAEDRPDMILTHAFEAGHPDHDACSFLAGRLSKSFGVEIWEMPFYRPNPTSGGVIHQQFLAETDDIVTLQPTELELATKRAMFGAHASQNGVLTSFDPERECFRPQPAYDYSRVALQGSLQVGPSRVSAQDLASAFAAFS